jgi:hypothetical protein
VEHNAGEMNRPTPLTFFSIGAVVDFVFGLLKWHSVVAGIVAVFCGLPLTGLLFLGFRASSPFHSWTQFPATERDGDQSKSTV